MLNEKIKIPRLSLALGDSGGGIQNKALRPSIQNLSGTEFLNLMLPHLIGLALIIGIVIFLFILLIGAIQWITSGGDKAGIESARGKITNAFIGIIILLAVFVLIKLVEDFFGINILTIDLGPFFIE